MQSFNQQIFRSVLFVGGVALAVSSLAETAFAKTATFKLPSSGIKKLCKMLADDGRQKPFYDIVQKAEATPEDDCKLCKKFFKTIGSRCKPKKEKASRKKDGPEAVTKVIHAEPSTELLHLISVLFREAEETFETIDEERLEVISTLLAHMRLAPGHSPDEKLYFTILSAFIESPYRIRFRLRESRRYKKKYEVRIGEAIEVFDE